MGTEPEFGRRRFIKESVLSIAKAATEYAKHRDAPREEQVAASRTDWLRPPGAVDEALFLERCTRCADCIEACPYDSIVKNSADGFPVVFADQAPCHLCEDFPCIAACETEALQPILDRSQVRMGVAVVTDRDCTASQGCHACVSHCPVEALAMDFGALRVNVAAQLCVGCGMCEQICRTVNDHIAIRVTPARLL